MKKQLFILLAGCLFSTTALADEGYLILKGEKQGEIKGDSFQKGRENWNTVVAFEYSTGLPPLSNGQATGRRVRPNVTFTLKLSKATPLLINAAVNSENLAEVKFLNFSRNFFMASSNGQEVLSQTIEFSNARILAVKIHDENGNEAKIDPLVTITMSYQKVTYTHTDGGLTAVD